MRRRARSTFTSNDEFYAAVRTLTDDLRGAGEGDAADRLTAAMTGGSTSGEILGDLRIELRALLAARPTGDAFSGRITELLQAVDEALRPRWF